MKLNNVLLGMPLAFAISSIANAKPAPVVDYSQNALGTSASAGMTQQLTNTLEEKIAIIERKIDSRNKSQVNVQNQLDELQNEVDELRGVTEQHSHQLGQVLERQRELYQELDRRVNEALKTPDQPVHVPSTTVGTTSYSTDLTENEAYDHALNMVLAEKRYEEAIPEFRAFNTKYPNSSYAANAHYWLGQLLYNKGDFPAAGVEFNRVVSQHKKSTKRSDAMLKLAMVEKKLNNTSKAKTIYQQVIAEYPSSNAAKLATSRLEKLSL